MWLRDGDRNMELRTLGVNEEKAQWRQIDGALMVSYKEWVYSACDRSGDQCWWLGYRTQSGDKQMELRVSAVDSELHSAGG